MTSRPKFTLGQLVYHRQSDYRGVVIDIDESFAVDADWHEEEQVAEPDTSKDNPWYRILVHDSDDQTYVAERNLEPDISGEPVDNPLIEHFFDTFEQGHYARTANLN